jgi:hypothetical protein
MRARSSRSFSSRYMSPRLWCSTYRREECPCAVAGCGAASAVPSVLGDSEASAGAGALGRAGFGSGCDGLASWSAARGDEDGDGAPCDVAGLDVEEVDRCVRAVVRGSAGLPPKRPASQDVKAFHMRGDVRSTAGCAEMRTEREDR